MKNRDSKKAVKETDSVSICLFLAPKVFSAKRSQPWIAHYLSKGFTFGVFGVDGGRTSAERFARKLATRLKVKPVIEWGKIKV